MTGLEFSGEAFEMAAGFYAALRPRDHAHPSDPRLTRSEPRNLVFYIHALTHGGAERVMAMIASAFADHGDHVTFIVDQVMPDHGLNLSKKIRFEMLAGSHSAQLRALRTMLNTIQPDLIISALSASNAKMAVAALAAGLSKRHVMTWHGFPRAETSILSRLGYAVLPHASRLSAQHICVSNALLQHMRHRGLTVEKSMCIYNPVDMHGLEIARTAKLADAPRIVLSAGRLAAVKNFPMLLEAFSNVPEKNSHLVILGDGPELPRLQRDVQHLALTDRVFLPGHIHDMSGWFSQADVFVLPSQTESFSNVIVEALSYGLPVVSTDCGGPREILDHGRYGALVPCGDADAMTHAISAALLDDGSQMDTRRARAQRFNIAAAMRQYDALFNRLIGYENAASLA